MGEQELMSIGVIVFVAMTILVGLYSLIVDRNSTRLFESIERMLKDKAIVDEAEKQYLRSSLATQDFIRIISAAISIASSLNFPVIDGAIDNLDEFLKDVTDGVGNNEEENQE